MSGNKRPIVLLVIIFTVALVLRVSYFWHGYPFIFHPDEPTIIRSALALRFNLNPGHFDWPHLFIYLNYGVYMLFAYLRNLIPNLNQVLGGVLYNDDLVFYYITRIFVGIIGALTIFPIYFATKNFFNSSRAGIFSALAIALMPLHVWNSHLALIDVPMVFFVSLVIYVSSLINKERKLRYYVIAGLLVGFAAATKYHGAFAGFVVAIVHFYDYRKFNSSFSDFYKLVVSGAVSLLGFVIAMPYALLDFETFTRTDGPKGALWQFSNVGHVPLFSQLLQFVSNFFVRIPDDIGYTFMVFLVGGLVYFLVSKRFSKELFLFYAMYLFLVFYISGFQKSRSHYLMITYPFIAVVVGEMLNRFTKYIGEYKFLAASIISVTFVIPLALCIFQNAILGRDDTRVQLYKWILSKPNTHSYFYSSSNLRPVFEKLKLGRSKQISEEEFVPNAGSYYIISEEDPSVAMSQMLVLPKSVEFVEMFTPNIRKGPTISISEGTLK